MLNAKRWKLIFKLSCGILLSMLVSFVFVGSKVLDLLYLCIIAVLFFRYVVDKKLK